MKNTETLETVIKTNKRYTDFTILDEPKSFDEMFVGQDIPCVQLHSTELLSDLSDIIGFCGTFSWENGVLTSLDGDSYTKNMSVLGYNWFTNESGKKCLDILVGDDW